MKKSTTGKISVNQESTSPTLNNSAKSPNTNNKDAKQDEYLSLLQQQLEVTMTQLVTQGVQIAQLQEENKDLKQNLGLQIEMIEDSAKSNLAAEEKIRKLEQEVYIQTEEKRMIQKESQDRLRFFES